MKEHKVLSAVFGSVLLVFSITLSHLMLPEADTAVKAYNEGTDHCEETTEEDTMFLTESNPDYVQIEDGWGKYCYTIQNNAAIFERYLEGKTEPPASGIILEIPGEVEGYPVRYIDKEALKDLTCISEVTLPDTLDGIGDRAFDGCTSLEQVHFPAGLTQIGSYAFRNCSALTSADLPDTLGSLGDGAFEGTGLQSIHIPSGLAILPDYAFSGCTALTSIEWPETKLWVGPLAFANTGITELYVPSNVTLSSGVFEDCRQLKRAVFADGQYIIGIALFKNCTALQEITLPSSIQSIASGFENCTALADLYYDGSVDQWNIIDRSWLDNQLDHTTIHCDTYADLNEDMEINAVDASLILAATATDGITVGTSVFTGQKAVDADVNFDGAYDSVDASIVLQYAAASGVGQKVLVADFIS